MGNILGSATYNSNGDLSVKKDLTVVGNTTLRGNKSVVGNSTISGTNTVTGASTFNGASTFGESATFSKGLTTNADIVLGNGAKIQNLSTGGDVSSTGKITGGSLEAGSSKITGLLEAGSVTTVGGVTAGSVTSSGVITAGSVTTTGEVSAASIKIGNTAYGISANGSTNLKSLVVGTRNTLNKYPVELTEDGINTTLIKVGGAFGLVPGSVNAMSINSLGAVTGTSLSAGTGAVSGGSLSLSTPNSGITSIGSNKWFIKETNTSAGSTTPGTTSRLCFGMVGATGTTEQYFACIDTTGNLVAY